MIDKKGTWHWIESSEIIYQRKKDKSPSQIFGTGRDISEKKLAAIALQKNEDLILEREQFLNTLITLAPDPFFHGDDKGKLLLVNEKACEMTEYSKEELLNMNIMELFSSDELLNKPLRIDLLDKGEIITTERELLSKSGNKCIVEMNSRKMPEGTYQSTFRDISERQKMLSIISESEQFLKETQQIAQLGTYTLDITTGIWSSSEILDTIFGITFDYDKSVQGWVTIIHPEWQEIMNNYLLKDVIRLRRQFNKEYKIIRFNDKQEQWVHGIGDVKFNDKNEPIKMVGTIRDITERKKIDQELIESQTKYKAIIEQSNDGITIADLQGKYQMVN